MARGFHALRVLGQWWHAEDAARARARYEGSDAEPVQVHGGATVWVVATQRGVAAYAEHGGWVVELPGEDRAATAAIAGGLHFVPAQPAEDTAQWPGASPRDLELVYEIIGLTRDALGTLLPNAGPFDGPVHLEVEPPGTSPRRVRPPAAGYDLGTRTVLAAQPALDRLTLAHEAAHALLHARFRFPLPPWFDEGLAQLAAAHVARGAPLPPPRGRPVGDFARLRALDDAAFDAAGPSAYASAAEWVGFLLPTGPAPPAEKAAFARYVATLLATRDPAAADRGLAAVHAAGPSR